MPPVKIARNACISILAEDVESGDCTQLLGTLQALWETAIKFSKNKNRTHCMVQQFYFWASFLRHRNQYLKEITPMFTVAVYRREKTRAQPQLPSQQKDEEIVECVDTMEYYSASQKREALPLAIM